MRTVSAILVVVSLHAGEAAALSVVTEQHDVTPHNAASFGIVVHTRDLEPGCTTFWFTAPARVNEAELRISGADSTIVVPPMLLEELPVEPYTPNPAVDQEARELALQFHRKWDEQFGFLKDGFRGFRFCVARALHATAKLNMQVTFTTVSGPVAIGTGKHTEEVYYLGSLDKWTPTQ